MLSRDTFEQLVVVRLLVLALVLVLVLGLGLVLVPGLLLGHLSCFSAAEPAPSCHASVMSWALELMRAWLLLSVATTTSTRCRLRSTTSGRSRTPASSVRRPSQALPASVGPSVLLLPALMLSLDGLNMAKNVAKSP